MLFTLIKRACLNHWPTKKI